MMVHEWALTLREAIVLQGDKGDMAILSTRTALVESVVTPPLTSLSMYLWRAAATTSFGLAALLMLFLSLCAYHRPVASNWFCWHRLVGAIWLSRSVVLLRALAATVALITTDIALASASSSVLTVVPKPLFPTFVLASEVLWLAYTIVDILAPWTEPFTSVYAPRASVTAWVLMVIYAQWDALTVAATLHRSCFVVNMDQLVVCTSGSVVLASVRWTLSVADINLVCMSGFALGHYWHRRRQLQTFVAQWSSSMHQVPSLALPTTAIAFVQPPPSTNGDMTLDAVTAAMCGLFYVPNRFIFDVELWRVFPPLPAIAGPGGGLWLPRAHAVTGNAAAPTLELLPHPPRTKVWHIFTHLESLAQAMGFLYLGATLFGNVAYLSVVQSNLANDYGWAGFNATGTYAFLGNLFNRRLLTHSFDDGFTLNDPAFADTSQLYNLSVGAIRVSGHAARRQLFSPDVALEDVVANLRRMDPCRLPWMFTQYCFVDLGRRWSLASSSAREARCRSRYVSNGAVYLETSLGNVMRWDDWTQCWGTSFEVGIATALATSVDGRDWLRAIQSNARSCVDEAAYWRQAGVAGFTLQWQNFKTTGFSDAFYIENALGLQYALPLSNTPGAYHLTQQNSIRMYWSFASDLWAISNNATLLGSASLVRQSPMFAYANTTPIAVLFQNLTLVPPLNAGLVSLETHIGPFGNVDMIYVPVPSSLSALYANFTGSLARLLLANESATQWFFRLPYRTYLYESLPGLGQDPNVRTVGGNLMCGSDCPAWTAMYGIDSFFGVHNLCHAFFSEKLSPTSTSVLFSLLGLNSTLSPMPLDRRSTMAAVCTYDVYATPSCIDDYLMYDAFASTYELTSVASLLATTVADLTSLNISAVQWLQHGASPLFLYMTPLLASDEVWSFYGWGFIYEWVIGLREVVAFDGDVGRVTTLSASQAPAHFSPESAAIAPSFSLACLVCVQYITLLLIVISVLVVCTALQQRGRVEALNLLYINRIVGLVWIGRPLLLVRSLTALWLLHTTPLELVQTHGVLTSFVSLPLLWYKVILAGAELTWSVYILNDLLSCLTQQYTALYAPKSSNLTWAAAIVWTYIAPQQHRAFLHRHCVAHNMDDALQCVSGGVEIGSVARVSVSIGIGILAIVVCCIFEVLRRPNVPPNSVGTLLLNAQSYYVLDFGRWTWEGDVYLDKMSAIMAGILAVQVRESLYVFDIKTWRLFHQPVEPPSLKPARLRQAVPLSRV
ncbi:hypothetical protein SDRG_03742 [Saprolegnia diclina VS20]|uniref:Uncharacterized protein n=1 Tax=Saprolegnia diclina (strain VS20) TaxID=1156394 RepID=T0S1B3_SAPDV|nr:hypothetical protein SDRG_03742 [Saprolegnia diclina VS20]EQC38783.1 hypothetical protein SDRG_03742 [Saprolegnia diclina VS20]|eukprot:XP_008607607.1 hypothetical protein SDRG_03742 [Saprolegnia diclina VS20]